MHLLIDGYNLLHAGRHLPRFRSPEELKRHRDRLLADLSLYRRIKGCAITVVFDGWQGGEPVERRERQNGIDLVFSRLGEKADDVIKRLVREKGSGIVVVTSDRDVGRSAEEKGMAVIRSEDFAERIGETSRARVDLPGWQGKRQADEEETRAEKKGPARRLSKKAKKLRETMKKL
jgi:predicted RNA-binding protein with PIN domain